MADETQKKPNPVMEERKANTARISAELETQGYHAEDATISVLKANVMAFVTALPFGVLFVVLFLVLRREEAMFDALTAIFHGGNFWFIPALLLSIPIHEGLHGLGWVLFCKEKGKSIQFGVMWESLTPYCHCREALTVGQYYLGLLLPFTVLGVVICVISIVIGNAVLLILGIYNILLAGGDTTIGCIIAKYLGKDVKILDHPDQCGAVAYVK